MRRIPKKWRDLPREERFKIPQKYFNLDEKEISRIRKIEDVKKRLIEAAKLQYETFNDIHSYLTTWIAGFGSDVIIRQRFGSTKNLLNLFFKPIKLPMDIKPSWQDIKRRIKIPEKMTEELAEETGIHIGDGNMYINKGNKWNYYSFNITGDLINELIYHKEHISKLIKGLYNLEPKILERIEKNSVDTRLKSKSIVEFKNKILKLPIGTKKDIKIPAEILKEKAFQKKCIVGIIDTDFSITSSLSISGKLHSLHLIKNIDNILKINGIKHVFRLYPTYGRFYIPQKEAIKIIEEWGLKNQKHLSKYNLFQEFGKFIPFSTTPERKAVLAGELELEELERICKKRAFQ